MLVVRSQHCRFPAPAGCPATNGKAGSSCAAAASPAKKDDDEDIDLFGESDEEESEEKAKLKEERLAAYAEKKAKKAGPVAKSNVIFDVKPWEDTTDLVELEKLVRGIAMDGLVWGSSELKIPFRSMINFAGKLMPVAFGIKKLQIGCAIEDDKVSTDLLEEQITAFEDYVQSVDIAAFQKI